MKSSLRSRLTTLARWGLPVVLVAVLFASVDLTQALASVAGAALHLVVLALGVVQVQIVLAALRWQITAKSIGQSLSIKRAVSEYYGASLLNMVLPGGVSGDVVRIVRTRERTDGKPGWEGSAHSVILERASGQLAFLCVASLGLGLWALDGVSPPQAASATVWAGFGIAALVAGLAVILGLIARKRLAAALRRFAGAARLAFLRPWQAAVQLALSLLIVTAYLLVFALASRAIGAPLDWRQTLLVVPPVLLTMVVPVSVGGWGVREAAAAALWPLVGYSAGEGIAASVLYGLVSTAGALPGLFTFDFARGEADRSRA